MTTTGTTPQRGYGYRHQQERARWQRRLDNGEQIVCRSTRCLKPGHLVDRTNWHLGHLPDRTGWTGPEVPRCNTTEGGTRGNQSAQRRAEPRSREW